jgi:hypothetical protein
MNQEKQKREKSIQVRVTNTEYEKLISRFKETACRKFSEYIRAIIFKKPVIVFTRDRSKDECLLELIQLKKELNAIGINFNQFVKRLHTIDHLQTAASFLNAQKILLSSVTEKITKIKDYMIKVSEQWSQE